MNTIFIVVWAALIFGSIAWYAFLVFYVGIKAGREVKELTETLTRRE